MAYLVYTIGVNSCAGVLAALLIALNFARTPTRIRVLTILTGTWYLIPGTWYLV